MLVTMETVMGFRFSVFLRVYLSVAHETPFDAQCEVYYKAALIVCASICGLSFTCNLTSVHVDSINTPTSVLFKAVTMVM